jgi:hypothetical protein
MFCFRNWKTHGEMYLKKCKELEIEPVKTALPELCKELGQVKMSSHPNLDGFVNSVPKWSKEGLLEHILDFIALKDQVSQIFSVSHLLVL